MQGYKPFRVSGEASSDGNLYPPELTYFALQLAKQQQGSSGCHTI